MRMCVHACMCIYSVYDWNDACTFDLLRKSPELSVCLMLVGTPDVCSSCICVLLGIVRNLISCVCQPVHVRMLSGTGSKETVTLQTIIEGGGSFFPRDLFSERGGLFFVYDRRC